MAERRETDELDDRIVARMRSALDEVTAGVDAEPLATVRPTPAAPRRRAAWVGVAAATVLLAGGAVWALSTRSGDPVASSEETSSVPPTSEPVTPTTSAGPSADVDAPSFTITSARLVPGRIETNRAEPAPGPLFVAWRIEGDGMDGFLFASLYDELDVPDAQSVDPLDPPVGEAQLIRPIVADAEVAVPWIRWVRPEGGVWALYGQGLDGAVSSNDWIDLAFEAVPGSGLPVVLPDDRASFLALGAPSTTVVTQAFTSIDDGSVDLTVTDGGAALFALVGATDVREVEVAGTAGWLGTWADGHVEVVWDAGGGWWGLLGISPDLAGQADDIVGSVVRVGEAPTATTATTVAIPATEQRYRTTASIIQIGDGPPMIAYAAQLSNPPQGGDLVLAGLDWADVPDAQTLNGTTWSGTLDLVGTFDGEVFSLTQPPAPATGNEGPNLGSELTPDCTDADVQPLLDVLRGLELESLGAIMTSDDRWDGRCGVFVWALADTPGLRETLAPLGDQVRVEFAITPV